MRFQDLVYDTIIAIITMFGLAILCSPILYFLWDYILIPLSDHRLMPMDIFTSLMVNFTVNLLIFFKLQKRDIIIAQPDYDESEENL